MHKSDAEYLILKKLTDNPYLTLRLLSKELGISLGKTNYVINALIDKGLLKLNNFKRSDNKLGYSYLLTAQGITEKTKLTIQFMKRKMVEYDVLKKDLQKKMKNIFKT